MTRNTSSYNRNSSQSTPPITVSARLIRLLYEARWLVLTVICVYLFLILFTYSSSDSGWSHSGLREDPKNWGGITGAWLSDLLLYVFGFSAWWWFNAFLIAVLVSYRNLSRRIFLEVTIEKSNFFEMFIRIIGFVSLIVASSGLEFLRMYSIELDLPGNPGGVVGNLIGTTVQTAFGFDGGTLILLMLFLLGFSLCFHVSWIAIAEKLGGLIENFGVWIKQIYSTYLDRRAGYEAALKREESIIQEKNRVAEIQSVQIVPQVMSVPKSERIEKEKQVSLFLDLPETNLPPLLLLDEPPEKQEIISSDSLEFVSRLIEKKLFDFGVQVRVIAAYPGPVITRYEIEPATGVKGAQIVNLARDLSRALSLVSIRVVETIPGKNFMGLELPNLKRQIVKLSEIIGSKIYNDDSSFLTIGLGKDIAGNPVVADLSKMPHLLIAGTTGSGKSVGINATILSLLYRADPNQVRLILIDPKMLELSIYEGIPHLLSPVVTDMKQAGHALNWAVNEMERRYKLMSKLGVRNLAGFNQKIIEADLREEKIQNPLTENFGDSEPLQKLPAIVIIIDELADLIMVVGKKVEELIARIAQKARAAGIHLILATQRPSVDVITGLIKANIPSRIAFQVSSKVDSRTILDQMGAETLLGMGDMLFLPPGTSLPVRVHGAFVSDEEVHRVVNHLKSQGEPNYIDGILDDEDSSNDNIHGLHHTQDLESDPMYDKAVAVVLENKRASISLVQRHLRIGYNRSARLLEQMEKSGLVSPMQSNGTREILIPKKNSY